MVKKRKFISMARIQPWLSMSYSNFMYLRENKMTNEERVLIKYGLKHV
jgi:hypothetical protein